MQLQQVLYDAFREKQVTWPVFHMCAAKIPGLRCFAALSSKARKVELEKTTLILNIDYASRPMFLYGSIKMHVVWVFLRTEFQELLQGRELTEFIGTFHIIDGHSPDCRRIYFKPIELTEDVAEGVCIMMCFIMLCFCMRL